MVITSRTRNAVVRKGTWVRIPHSPPSKNPVTMRVSGFFFFCARSKNHPVLSCSFHKFWKEQLLALFPAFFCVLLPSAAEIARFGKRHPAHHRLRRGEFRTVIQMGVNVCRGGKIRMSQPVLNLLERYAVCQQEGGAAMPLRYNYDKPEKPRRIKGFEVFSLIFSSFSKPKNHTEISRIAGGVSLTTNE